MQQWLRKSGYQPSKLPLKPHERIGARLLIDSLPPAGERVSGNYSVVTVESVFDFLQAEGLLASQFSVKPDSFTSPEKPMKLRKPTPFYWRWPSWRPPSKGKVSSLITVLVVSAPLILSSGLDAGTHANIEDASEKRKGAEKLPPMKVERIGDREDGSREVELVPEDAAIEGNALRQ